MQGGKDYWKGRCVKGGKKGLINDILWMVTSMRMGLGKSRGGYDRENEGNIGEINT